MKNKNFCLVIALSSLLTVILMFLGWFEISRKDLVPSSVKRVYAGEWLGDWRYRKKITIDETDIDSSLTFFPLTVILDEDIDFFSELGAGDSKKVAFTKSDGITQLYAEVEQFDPTNEKAVFHVSKSDWIISSTEPTELYVYYYSNSTDNTAYIGDPGSIVAQNVWDSNFTGVWHKNDGASQAILDSTSNGFDGTKITTSNPLESDGKIGKAQDYSSDDVSFGNLGISNDYTAEAWIKADTLGGGGDGTTYGNTIMSSASSGSGYPLWVTVGKGNGTEVTFRAFTNSVTGANTVGANLNTTNWFHIVAIASKSSTAKVYVNAVERLSFTAGSTDWTTEFFTGDLRRNRAIYFDGLIDEIRLSNTIRSAAWVKATYESGNNSLLSFGVQEDANLPFAPNLYSEDVVSQVSFNNIHQYSTTPIFRVSSTVADGDIDSFHLELNTNSDFTGTSYEQTFSSNYTSGMEYNLFADSLSPNLPTTDGVTYYVRVRARASSDNGSHWGVWSTEYHPIWTFTYKSTNEPVDWFQTTTEQFNTGILVGAEVANDSVYLTGAIEAIGGIVTEVGNYTIHTFTSSGTFEITDGMGEVEYFVVGGGGGTGPRIQGGGGGGGVVQGVTTLGSGSYSVNVGAGGAAALTTNQNDLGNNGSSSSFSDIATAIGGGRGGSASDRDGAGGGSGGGARGNSSGSVGGTAVLGQGNDGGANSSGRGGAGGGGAGEKGQDGQSPSYTGGDGGDGIASDFSGTMTYYAGGGAGGAGDGLGRASGGLGGGGDGGQTSSEDGQDGAANTGGGGGAGGFSGNANAYGGSGGSGIVMVRYDNSNIVRTIMSPEVDFDSVLGKEGWGEVGFSTVETNGDIKISLYYSSTTPCDTIIPNTSLAGNEEGFDIVASPVDISGLDTTTYNEICLQATLIDIDGTPYLEDWSVSWGEDYILSVSIVDGSVAYGRMPKNALRSTLPTDLDDIQVVSSNSSDLVDLYIKGYDATGGGCEWTLSSSNGLDQYSHQFCNASDNDCSSPPTYYTFLTTTYSLLRSNLPVEEELALHFCLLTPTISSCSNEQSVNVTVLVGSP